MEPNQIPYIICWYFYKVLFLIGYSSYLEKGPHHGSPQNCLQSKEVQPLPNPQGHYLQVEETECKLGPIPLGTLHSHWKVSDIPGLWAIKKRHNYIYQYVHLP